MKKILKRNELYLAATILLFSLIVELKSGEFFTANNLVDLMRSLIVPGMFACGLMLEIVSGGIDVSFPAMAMLSSYATVIIVQNTGYQGSVVLPFLLSGVFGALMGLFNSFFITWLKLPPFIITLGTSSVYLGILQGALKSKAITILPENMTAVSKSYLFTVTNGESGLQSVFPTIGILLPVTAVAVWLLGRYTMLGRGIYAMGGDKISAERAGFNTTGLQYFVFTLMGALSGIVGMTRVEVTGVCQPTALIGYEMTIIATVVLGGTRMSGGHGNVFGVMLGVILLTMVNNSLILLGIPTYWSKFVTGVLIIIGIGVTSYRTVAAKKRIAANVLEQ